MQQNHGWASIEASKEKGVGREQEKSSATQHLELHPPPAPNWEYDETSRRSPFEFRVWAWCVRVCVHCVLAVFFVKGEPHESQVTRDEPLHVEDCRPGMANQTVPWPMMANIQVRR